MSLRTKSNMKRNVCVSGFILLGILTFGSTGDERVHFSDEAGKRLDTASTNTRNGKAQPRFLLPFSASFSLSAGANNAHSLSVGAGHEGISLSQSTSQSLGNKGPGLSASQSSSFSAGLNGISAADSQAFNSNHPLLGSTSDVNGNSFSFGQASANSQGTVVNGQASSSAQSSAGSAHSSASSGASSAAGNEFHPPLSNARPSYANYAPNYNGYRGPSRPTLTVQQRPPSWTRPPGRRPVTLDVEIQDNHRKRRPEVTISKWNPDPHPTYNPWRPNRWTQNSNQRPAVPNRADQGPSNGWASPQPGGIQISSVSASSSSSSNSNGFSSSSSSSQSNSGPNGSPITSTVNQIQTSGNAQGHAQGAAAAVGQSNFGQTDASFSSGAISGGSNGNGQSFGSSNSGNRGPHSHGHVNSQSFGSSSVQGTANAGSVSVIRFPEDNRRQNVHNIPREFVRSGKKIERDPVDLIITNIEDTVADLLDI